MWMLYVLAYLTIGYVTSVLYERRRRWKIRQCYVCEKIRTGNYGYHKPTCHQFHADGTVLWWAIPGWPVFLVGRLSGLFIALMKAISPAKAADKVDEAAKRAAELAEERRVAAEAKRKEKAEEAARKARGLVLVEGKDEVDS